MVPSALQLHDGSQLQVVSGCLASRLGACTIEWGDMLQTVRAGPWPNGQKSPGAVRDI